MKELCCFLVTVIMMAVSIYLFSPTGQQQINDTKSHLGDVIVINGDTTVITDYCFITNTYYLSNASQINITYYINNYKHFKVTENAAN